ERARWLDRYTWRALDGGIVVAHGQADWYATRGFGPRAKFHVLWKGVDLPQFDAAAREAPAQRAALGLRPGELAIGTFGRLAWQKGYGDLLEAVQLVRARVPQAR